MTLGTTFLKALLYRVYSSLVTMGIAYAVTRHVSASCVVGGLEFVTKIFTYSAFERSWLAIAGRKQ